MRDFRILGVCEWLSQRFGLSLEGCRWLFIIATFFGFGSPIILYLILYVIKPKTD